MSLEERRRSRFPLRQLRHQRASRSTACPLRRQRNRHQRPSGRARLLRCSERQIDWKLFGRSRRRPELSRANVPA